VRIDRVVLQRYRNLEAVDVELGPRFSVFSGHNGAGKTNLLEAIHLIATLRSFRTSEITALIQRGAHMATIAIDGLDPTVDVKCRLLVKLERQGNTTRRLPMLDGKLVRPASAFYGRVRAVLFTPEDLGVLRGPPVGRRNLIDRMVFAHERSHIEDVQIYEKLLRSRNHLLKDDRSHPVERRNLLETYERELSRVGAKVWTRRIDALATIEQPFRAAFQAIDRAGQPCGLQADLAYLPRLGDVAAQERERALLAGFEQRRHHDEQRGTTSIGPHTDDVQVTLDGTDVSTFASQGQLRALMLAFKLAELRCVRDLLGFPPVLLLDDVSSELDPERTEHLFDELDRLTGQCILTTTAPRFIPISGASMRCDFAVSHGVVST